MWMLRCACIWIVYLAERGDIRLQDMIFDGESLAWCEIVMKKTKEYMVDELQVYIRNSHWSVAWGGGGGGGGSLAIWLATHPCPKKASIGYIFQPYGGVDVFLKKGGVFFILHRTLGVPCSTMLQNNSNTPFRVIFAGFTPFGGVNETWCDTPFRVQFRGWWTRVGSQLVCEWPPPPPGGLSGYIRPQTFNWEVPGSNLLAAAVVPLGNALYPHCLVPQRGL